MSEQSAEKDAGSPCIPPPPDPKPCPVAECPYTAQACLGHDGVNPHAYRPIAHHWCGQTQPHGAHDWQTPPAYGMATFVQTYQCGGYVTPPEGTAP